MTDVPGLNDDPPEDEHEDEPEGEPEREEGGTEEEQPAGSAEVEKWKKRAAARDRKLREAQAELAKLRAKEEGNEPDPVAQANARLVAASARTQLAAAGVTDREDQRAVIGLLRLDDIEVDADGDVDEEAIEERIERLRTILGTKTEKRERRTPRVDTRDKGAGTKDTTTDADSQRYRRILGAR